MVTEIPLWSLTAQTSETAKQRSAKSGWVAKDDSKSRWGHDKYDGLPKSHENSRSAASVNNSNSTVGHRDSLSRSAESDAQRSRTKGAYEDGKSYLNDKDKRELQKRSERHEKEDVGRRRDEKLSGRHGKEDQGRSRDERRSGRHEKEDQGRSREERRSGRHHDEANKKQDRERRGSRHNTETYMKEDHGYRSRYDERTRSDTDWKGENIRRK